jgi:hypothetical protein
MLPNIQGTSLPAPPWSGFSFERVLQYYDGPRLLLQRSLAGQLFLAWWSDSDEAAERWIYLPLSEPRLHTILSGEIPSLDGLNNPEDGFLYAVDIDENTGSVIRTVLTDAASLPQDALPLPGATLNIPVPEEISRLPQRDKAQLLDLRMEGHVPDLTKIQDNLHLEGEFVAGNIRTLQFEIRTADSDERFEGLIDEDTIGEVERITLGSLCRVVLQPHLQVSEVTGEEITTYTLLSIEPLTGRDNLPPHNV